MSLNNLPINSSGAGGDTAEIVEAGDILSFQSPDGTYYLNSDRTVEGTVYPAGTTLLKDGNEFVEVGGGGGGPGITPNNPNFQRLLSASRHTPLKVANLEAYRIFATQQAFITHHVTQGTNGLAAGVFGTAFDVTSSAPQPLTLRPILIEFTPAGQTEIIGENTPAGNGFEILSDQDGIRYKFWNGIWINAAINKWYILGVAGQSNSVGYAFQIADENYDSKDPRIYQLGRFNGYFNKIIPATHSVHHIDNRTSNNQPSVPAGANADTDIRAGNIGPAKYLADKLIRNLPDNTGILIVGGGNGGTGFSSALQGNTFNAYPNNYNLVRAQLSSGENLANGEVPYGAQENCRRWGTNQPMFNDFVYRLKLALQLPNSHMLGVYWAQGEADVSASNINLTTSVGALIDEFNNQMATNNTQMPDGDVRNLGWYMPSFTIWGQEHSDRLLKQQQIKTLSEQRDNVYYVDVWDAKTNPGDPIHFSNIGYRETVVPRVYDLFLKNNFSKGVFLKSTIEEDVLPELDNGLVLHMDFEDRDTLYNSGKLYSTHGVSLSNVAGTPSASITNTGRKGRVVSLNNNNVIGLTTNGFTDSFTFSVAIYCTSVSQANNIFTAASTGSHVLWLSDNNTIQVHFTYPGLINEYNLTSGSFLNRWFHITHRYTRLNGNNGKSDLFIDGVLVSSAETSVLPNITNMLLGRYANVGFEFHGHMDDIRLYNRAITDKEVSDIYTIDGEQNKIEFSQSVTDVIQKDNDLVPDLYDGLILNMDFESATVIENKGLSPLGVNATTSNVAGTPSASITTTGRTGRVVSLDNNNVIGINTIGFNGSFTFSLAFRSDDLTDANNIFTSTSTSGHVLWLNQANSIQVHFSYPGIINEFVLPTGSFLNRWFHVIHRYTRLSGNTGRSDLFLNGELVSTANTTQVPNISSMQLGRYATVGFEFMGLADDVKLYNRDLTNNEVQALYLTDGKQELPSLQNMVKNSLVSNSKPLNPLQFESTTHTYVVTGWNGNWSATRTGKTVNYSVQTVSGRTNRPNDLTTIEGLSW